MASHFVHSRELNYIGQNDVHRSLFLFILGLSSATQIKVIGYISISEIFVAGIVLFVILYRSEILFERGLKTIWVLLILWFLSAVMTDLYRETNLVKAIKGCTTPLLWLNSIVAMYYVLRAKPNLLKWFVLGAALSSVISLFIFKPGSIAVGEMIGNESLTWNYRVQVGVVTTIVYAGLCWLYPSNKNFVFLLMAAFGIVSFYEGARSAGALALLAASLYLFRNDFFVGGSHSLQRMTIVKLVCLAIVSVSIVIGISEGYHYVVVEGYLGRAERARYIKQSASKVGILGARSEFAAAAQAISDSPVLGHGSWAQDKKGYSLMGARILGVDVSKIHNFRELLIPAHSHLWGPWVNHGFLGFLFWFAILVFVVRFAITDLSGSSSYFPFLLLFCINYLWHIVFSPVGFRPFDSAVIAFMVIMHNNGNVPDGSIGRR